MQARLGDSVSGRYRPAEKILLTKHVVAAGTFAKDAGSTPAASSLRSERERRTKTAAPEPAFEVKAGRYTFGRALRTTTRQASPKPRFFLGLGLTYSHIGINLRQQYLPRLS